LRLCSDLANRQLLVAMLQMRYGEGFVEILRKEYDRLADVPKVQEAYALTCYFHNLFAALPQRVLLGVTGLNSTVAIAEFMSRTEGLIEPHFRGVTARHKRIARVVSNYVYRTPEVRQRAVCQVLSTLSPDHDPEKALFLDLLSAPGRYKRILSECNRNTGLVEGLYRDVLAKQIKLSRYFKKYIHSNLALSYRALGELDMAVAELEAA
jgi:hypothetical protein